MEKVFEVNFIKQTIKDNKKDSTFYKLTNDDKTKNKVSLDEKLVLQMKFHLIYSSTCLHNVEKQSFIDHSEAKSENSLKTSAYQTALICGKSVQNYA
ncbi:CLUMA_CG008391, isoform A [Clunio marinus]|uniref:CLUMA_CG008391, isoform A n=1 Tax=Clunio marinus TaxID=568069 RepID=A0A1J1I3X6_9DIPT|nr:CLUMA_CG008391, isoform A [Clunio marinus]